MSRCNNNNINSYNNSNFNINSMKSIIGGGPRIVEDEVDVSYVERSSSKTALVRPIPVSAPNLIKPVAIKVVRPIPQRASEQFYNEAFEEKLTLKETSAASALANDWHRKWTQQDEQNHTTPDVDFYASSSFLPGHYGLEVDRQGATNPSLFASDDSVYSNSCEGVKRALNPNVSTGGSVGYDEPDLVLFHPEDRLSESSWSANSNSSSLSSHMAPQVKRRFIGAPIEDEDGPSYHAPMAVRPAAVRPVAIRAMRPEISSDDIQEDVPHDIIMNRQYGNVSPISLSDQSLLHAPEMTVVQQESEIVHVVEDVDDLSCSQIAPTKTSLNQDVISERDAVLYSLAVTQGDVDSPKFKSCLDPLLKYYSQGELEGKPHLLDESKSVDGMWLTLSKPSYFGCLGENDNGDPMYTLGRMAFDMFSPTNLVCSVQGNFNPVEIVSEEERTAMLERVPKSLRDEVQGGKTELRTYHVVSAFTIEPALASFPDAPNKDVHRPIKGIMTTFGYSLPDPNVADRHSIWFTGGRIEPNSNPLDISEWKRLFSLHPPKHSFGEKAKLLAVKLLMGATVPESMASDGSMEFNFTRPIGGHGIAFIDVVYLDETLRIVRGHRGTIFVFSRVPQTQKGRIQ